MEKTREPFSLQLRARYEETDQMGVVYYSKYLVWFEAARTEYFRFKGMVYRELEDREKLYLPVIEAFCNYKFPIKYDDLITIETKVSEIKSARLTFQYEIFKEGKLTTTGYTKHVFVNEKGRPVQIPEFIRAKFDS